MFEANDDNFAELRPSLRDFIHAGPCQVPPVPDDYRAFFNYNKLFGIK
jgi:hypothetical protein